MAMDPQEVRLSIASALGQAIRARREDHGWSVELLAGLTGIAKSTMLRIEMGANCPQADTFIRIAAALQVPVEELLPKGYLEEYRPKVQVLPVPRAAGSSRRSSRRSGSLKPGTSGPLLRPTNPVRIPGHPQPHQTKRRKVHALALQAAS